MPPSSKSDALAGALLLVALLPRGDGWLVVAGERGVGGVGDAGGEQRGGGAEQGVADLDVVVEERQRPAGVMASSQRLTLASSAAIGLRSTP